MKKLIFLKTGMLLSLFLTLGCSKTNDSDNIPALTELTSNQVLVIGTESFRNYEDITSSKSYLTQIIHYNYELLRTSNVYTSSNKYVFYNNYYYYWNITPTTQDYLLGNKTVSTSYKYSYIIYEDDVSLLLKTETIKKETFDYTSKWIDLPFNYYLDLNGYFASLNDLEIKCPDLLNLIDVDGTKKYYVDADSPVNVSKTTQKYSNTYYIETIKN